MIISHSQRFIFLANRKTASTSIGIALSSSCDKQDVITPLGRDEAIRERMGYPGPRNYIPWHSLPSYAALRIRRKLSGRSINSELKQIGYHTHITASEALKRLGGKKWHDYFRFCFVRNPWDRAISHYFWITRDQENPMTLDEYIDGPALTRSAHESRMIYTIDDRLVVHRLCRFENAQAELNRIFEELNLKGNPSLPESKRQYRQDRRHYRDVLNDAQAARIALIFEKEISLTGYQY